MQVTHELVGEPEFVPFTITLTIQSYDEADMLFNIFNHAAILDASNMQTVGNIIRPIISKYAKKTGNRFYSFDKHLKQLMGVLNGGN